MNLGVFSISLTVKDLEASRAFYDKFGFTVFAGDASQNWLILKNGNHVIGLFQGLFEKNTLTFIRDGTATQTRLIPSPTFALSSAN